MPPLIPQTYHICIHPLLLPSSHAESQSFTMCCVHLLLQSSPLFLASKVPSHFFGARSKQPHTQLPPGPAISPRPHTSFWLSPHFSVSSPGKLLQQAVYAFESPFVSHSIVSLLSLLYTLWLHKLVFVKTTVNPYVAKSWGPSAHLQLT